MNALDRLVRKLEDRTMNRSMDSILLKLEGEVVWELEKRVICKGYDRDGQVVVECNG